MLLNVQVAGIMRSLLGPTVGLPIYGGHNVASYVAHLFFWLRGNGDEFSIIGGQGWPLSSNNQIRPAYGYGCTDGYLPDWRTGNADGYARGKR